MSASRSDRLLRACAARRSLPVAAAGCALLLAAALAACGDDGEGDDPPDHTLTRAELLDPQTCSGCHPRHYREWASSMHAYASKDPVFVAMNRRGQRETGGDGEHAGGELGDFCVDCHAPMAVREGATTDGLNLDEVPEHLQGVTCYFCHNAVGVGDHFNNDVELANDTVMRGGLVDPAETAAHGSKYSSFHDRNHRDSTELCGGCHDIVTPAGVHLERTFVEYKESVFATRAGFETCGGCHMEAVPTAGRDDPHRDVAPTVHSHLWPGVDVALTDFPDRELQRAAIECFLSDNARVAKIDYDNLGGFKVFVETDAGHSQPSGSAQDRRLWVEFIAYGESGDVLFSSGDLGDGELEEKPAEEAGYDRYLSLLRDRLYDERGEPVHMFWEAAPSDVYPKGYSSWLLPAPSPTSPAHSIEVEYAVARYMELARVTVRLRMRPIGIDVLQDLVDSGDLDPALLAQMPTITLHGASVEWTPAEGSADMPRSLWPDELQCPQAYLCTIDPDHELCSGR